MTDPGSINRPRLADKFRPATPDRSASLSGLLPPAPAATQPAREAPPKVEPPKATPQEPRTENTRPTPRRKPAAPKASSRAVGGVENVPVHLEPAVLDVVRQIKSSRQVGGDAPTYDELLVEALTNVKPEQLQEAFTAPAAAGIAGAPLQPRIRAPRGSGRIQIQLRLDEAQRNGLDKLVSDSGAPSRSAFVNAVYRLAYGGSAATSQRR